MTVQLTRHPLFVPLSLLLATVAVALLSYTGLASHWLAVLTEPLFNGALAYARQAGHEASLALLILSGLHAGLATAESGQVGIALFLELEVNIGRLLSSLVDLSGKAYHVALVDRIIWEITHLMLHSLQRIQGWLLTLFLCLLLLHGWLRVYLPSWGHWHFATARLARTVMLLLVSLCVLFPLALVSAQAVSTHLVAEQHREVHDGYSQLDKHLNEHVSGHGLKNRAEHAIKRLEKAAVKLEHKVHSLSANLARHVAVLLFNTLLIPCGIWLSFVALWRLATRGFLSATTPDHQSRARS